MEQCLNCGAALGGSFCGSCGQRRLHGRLDLHEVFHETVHAFTHADQGIVRLVKDLALRPRVVYRDYFAGRRRTYFNPVLFLLLVLGVTIAAQSLVLDRLAAHPPADVSVAKLRMERAIAQMDKVRYFVVLPVVSLLAWGLFPRRYHFAEIIVFWLFCLGWANALGLPFLAAAWLLPERRETLTEIAGWLGALAMLAHLWVVFFARTWWSAFRCVALMLASYIALDYSFKLLWVLKGERVSLNLFELIADWFKLLR